MFKSVFTKYIAAFMIIIIISFAVLAAIVSAMFIKFSESLKRDIMEKTSVNVVNYLINDYNVTDEKTFNHVINNKYNAIKSFISSISPFSSEEILVMISDSSGLVLINDSHIDYDYIVDNRIPDDAMQTVLEADGFVRVRGLEGVFETEHLSYATPIICTDEDGVESVVGAVFVCSSSSAMTDMVETLLKTIVMASLWVMLASLIAVYFISEKNIGPLKEMSRAAKSFAAGQFDVRVPVKGSDEVAELALAFNNMANSLENNEEMRRTFLANVSHDLKTPMTVISGFIDGILDGAIPPEKYEYYLGLVSNEVRRLSRLVSTLLDISKIQAGERKFNSSPFDICEMAREILISFEKKIEAKKLDVEFECQADNIYAMADHDAIYQILYNICDNGIKFSRDGGKYRIRIICREKKIFVSVYNEGIGISEDELPYVFERFFKSDKSRGLDKTGVGLGMFIAKTIIDAHHEEIWVKSVFNEYCEFVFTLTMTDERPKPVEGIIR